MRYITLIAVFCASALLVGCANHSQDYLKKGGHIDSLVVPPGVPMIKQQSYFPIPKDNYQGPKSVSLKPPTLRK